MAVFGKSFEITTRGENDIVDVSAEVDHIVKESGLREGMACVFVSGSTGSLTTIEYEPGLLEDLPNALERLAPKDLVYQHHLRWQDGNGHSHVRASIMGPSLTIPFRDGAPILGTWQQVAFIEMDVRSRKRTIHVQLVGE